jgi:hypothetical protein
VIFGLGVADRKLAGVVTEAPERECESSDLTAVLFAAATTSCEMALTVGRA